jgi:hypothetical protein
VDHAEIGRRVDLFAGVSRLLRRRFAGRAQPGWTVCRPPRHPALPGATHSGAIIALTANAFDEDVQQSLQRA